MWGGKQIYSLIGAGTAGAAYAMNAGTVIYTFTIPFRSVPIRSAMKMVTGSGGAQVTTATFTRTDAGDCGTLTIPITATTGQIYYETTTYTTALSVTSGHWLGSLAAGDRVTCTVAGTDSGTGIPIMTLIADPETPTNDSNMVAC